VQHSRWTFSDSLLGKIVTLKMVVYSPLPRNAGLLAFTLHCPDVINMVSATMTRSFLKIGDDAEVERVIAEAMKELNKK
jgi:hypothetical protein